MKVGGIATDQLRSLIERVERLKEEQTGIGADIRDIFAEAKGAGFCCKAMRKIIALRKMSAQEREEAEHMLDTYKRALGMQPDLFDEQESKPHEEESKEASAPTGNSLEAQAAAYT